MKHLCEKHNVTRQAISRIWLQGKASRGIGGYGNVASRKKGRCGRKPKHTLAQLEASVKDVPTHARSTYRSLSAASGIPVATLWKLLKAKAIRRRSSRLKPMLTVQHKAQRLSFVRGFIKSTREGGHTWHDMLDRVHVDEKWYYITKLNRKYYLWHDEDVPQRKC
ncbi:hypothetical protein H310_11735 [Aphanomyces invadans]|uniref:Transposase Tc1-like domain-containing protein n=1 Tax=Aphanomyces invadans TaxID=157072 RepID=A0A024TL97_9STRA|nr:hypothetical protein H310_11735 [Aphanomyces invadans]ETV94779.1 hypothetical protein H310_11735 [Aphanomyces invadans]|eukprot:XP_008876724.1 hypothetical protein H310_11735 [Aphanomyces invadans]